MSIEYYYGTGRRKTSTARVFIKKGSGSFEVNKKSLQDFFGGCDSHKITAISPLKVTDMLNKFDIKVTVRGGGITGQADAIRHGLTRALISYDEEGVTSDGDSGSEGAASTFRKLLRAAGFVTRDSRKVERKKFGHRKARKSEQYSKR